MLNESFQDIVEKMRLLENAGYDKYEVDFYCDRMTLQAVKEFLGLAPIKLYTKYLSIQDGILTETIIYQD